MCVLAFAWRAHPHWPLIAAGNRDELHARPAQPLARWDRPDHLLAGRDLQSGGTWPGVSEQGRFAVVTHQIGRAACRERVCQYVVYLVVGGSLKKKTHQNNKRRIG